MIHRIEVGPREPAENGGLIRQLESFGLSAKKLDPYTAYLFPDGLDPREARRIAEELLIDPVLETYTLDQPLHPDKPSCLTVEILRRPGVTDPVEQTVQKGGGDLGIRISAVKRIRGYHFHGLRGDRGKLERAVYRYLANPVIEQAAFGERIRTTPRPAGARRTERTDVPIRGLDDEGLERLSQTAHLSLTLDEMRRIREEYERLGRNPSDVELETIAQTWSEHCLHKTLRGTFETDDGQKIENLLKSTVMRATRELDLPWCWSVFEDNAGIIALDEEQGVAFKVETHNHPSAIEPYGGAGTGIGGVIRDILGCGLGAKPILNTDIFCVGNLEAAEEEIPAGVIHPREILRGVVAGVRDYGNRMGIPTVNGAVCVQEGYTYNPLVFCGTVGLIPKGKVNKKPRKGDKIVVVGGRTGRDGIHGATFSSTHLTEESEETSIGAVQIGNPVIEKMVLDTLLVARDRDLFTCVTDCGAGGLSSAVGEMGQELGGVVDLDRVPLKYEGLRYDEIWISEAQERMVLAVAPEKVEELLALFSSEDVEGVVIGEFTGDGQLVLRYAGTEVGRMEMEFLHEGWLRPTLRAELPKPDRKPAKFDLPADPGEMLKRVLSRPDVFSKEWIIRQYDHEVQGGSVLKPLQGVAGGGPGDAAIVTPLLGGKRGVAVGNGIRTRYGELDPYRMAVSAIDEAVRQVLCVGGSLQRLALLDNFCWGDVSDSRQLGALVEASRACYDMAMAYGTPFISGKDSLHNEYRSGGETRSIPPTLLISSIGILEDASKAVSMDLKKAGNRIFLLGITRDELGGSQYLAERGISGGAVPGVEPQELKKRYEALSRAIGAGRVRACHDLSDGGLAVAAAETAFAGGLGMTLDLSKVPADGELREDVLLFSESNGRFLVEVSPENAEWMEKEFSGLPFAQVGEVTESPLLRVTDGTGETILEESIDDLRRAWSEPLPRIME